MAISYLNTDLDLKASTEISALLDFLESQGISSLYVDQNEHGIWVASLETDRAFTDPATNITAMLNVIDRLEGELLDLWRSLTRREFNIGYGCGNEPRVFSQEIPDRVLEQIVKIGASLRITLYPSNSDQT
jgi:hypothetical protein